jgi:hypothetical protein
MDGTTAAPPGWYRRSRGSERKRLRLVSESCSQRIACYSACYSICMRPWSRRICVRVPGRPLGGPLGALGFLEGLGPGGDEEGDAAIWEPWDDCRERADDARDQAREVPANPSVLV